MIYIDTHAHIDDSQFDEISVEKLVKDAGDAGVRYIIAPGIDLAGSLKLKSYSEKFPHIFFSAGIHAHEASKFYEKDYFQIRKLMTHPKAIAVGEVGLDYHYDFSPRLMQIHVFKRFVELALKVDKPMIIHCRESEEDMYNILSENPGVRGVIHCYTGNVEWAKKFVDLGFYIGFTGVITFKNSHELRQVVSETPIERILTETDSPYMTPAPYRKIRPNEPRYVIVVADKIAEIKEVDREKACKIFLENAGKCFGIGEILPQSH